MKNVLVLFSSRSKRHSSADGFAGPLSSGDSTAGRASSVVKQEVARLKAAEEARKAREERLAKLNPFCLDATIVECLSAGQESVEDKVNAFKLLSQCGLKNIVLAAFVKEKTPDLKFLQVMRSQNLINEHCFAFSELFDVNGSDLPGQDLPFGLAKMIQYGIQNAILECDLAAPYINWNKYSTEDFCALVESRCRWVAANLYAGRATQPTSYIHLRDFATAMQVAPSRVLELVEYLGRLEPGIRPKGILLHESASGHFPFEAAPCVAAVRAVMDGVGWTGTGTGEQDNENQGQANPRGGRDSRSSSGSSSGSSSSSGFVDGALLVHVTAGYGLAHATVLECLAAGCTGVMASLCEEAEPTSSHASSLLDLLNLSRLGNPHVAAQFDMEQLRSVARQVSAAVRRAEQKRHEQQLLQQQQEEEELEEEKLQREAAAAAAAAALSQQRQPLILGHA